jgi:hypothetical protein
MRSLEELKVPIGRPERHGLSEAAQPRGRVTRAGPFGPRTEDFRPCSECRHLVQSYGGAGGGHWKWLARRWPWGFVTGRTPAGAWQRS